MNTINTLLQMIKDTVSNIEAEVLNETENEDDEFMVVKTTRKLNDLYCEIESGSIMSDD